jgi:RNA recognition motif-containing protein
MPEIHKIPTQVFFASIPFSTTAIQLMDMFSQVGVIQDLKQVTDTEGNFSGHGFVLYQDAIQAYAAIRCFHNKKMGNDDRRITVKPSTKNSLELVKMEIESKIDDMDIYELYSLLKSMKAYTTTNYEQSRILLKTNSNLTIAFEYALDRWNNLDAETQQSVLYMRDDDDPEYVPTDEILREQLKSEYS